MKPLDIRETAILVVDNFLSGKAWRGRRGPYACSSEMREKIIGDVARCFDHKSAPLVIDSILNCLLGYKTRLSSVSYT